MIKNFIIFLSLSVFAFAELKNITPSQLHEKIKEGVVVIDIRTPPEWKETGVIPTSETIMFFNEKGAYDVQSWLEEFSKYVKDTNQPFVLICRSGNRTGTVGNFLSNNLGYKNIYHLQHGIKSWIKDKREVEEFQQ